MPRHPARPYAKKQKDQVRALYARKRGLCVVGNEGTDKDEAGKRRGVRCINEHIVEILARWW